MKTVTLGGERLGSGKKQKVSLHGYERSTHDLSYLWKSTMSAGTLVPFMVQLALPGDTFDINLDALVKTHPTIGPLFGSFKLQLDVFTAPIRLYHKVLHNNKLEIGMSMADVKLPQIQVTGININVNSQIPAEFQQINQSSLLAYLGIRGLGAKDTVLTGMTQKKNGIPLLAYWDIFKNYYANKQEDFAYVIHAEVPAITSTKVNNAALPFNITFPEYTWIDVEGTNITFDNVALQLTSAGWVTLRNLAASNLSLITNEEGKSLRVQALKAGFDNDTITASSISADAITTDLKPTLTAFEIKNIDTMKETILSQPASSQLIIDDTSLTPYSLMLDKVTGSFKMYAVACQEGLAVKTYQSDIFNNWIKTDWIDDITAATAISTAGGSFTIDTLNLSKKVYDLLNRIAVTGASYQDWLESVYDHDSRWRAESPVYQGGLSKEIVFQEVISQAASSDEPLGTLAGKGVMGSKHKGGKMIINVDEPSFIIGIVSITPRICYSQGNEWWTSTINTLDDLHKPALDGIGFQDLVAEQFAFWTTKSTNNVRTVLTPGKQPAWINYMTNHDKSYGNFADPRTQMFMTLDRRYQWVNEEGELVPDDITTYIDPAKFNYAFAQTDLSAMNFWVQIAVDEEARRKMSTRQIPNL